MFLFRPKAYFWERDIKSKIDVKPVKDKLPAMNAGKKFIAPEELKALAKTLDNYENVLVWLFPVDQRSKELVPRVLAEYRSLFTVMPKRGMLAACDEIISFRWDDNYCIDLPFDVVIFDVHGANRTDVLAPERITDIRGLNI